MGQAGVLLVENRGRSSRGLAGDTRLGPSPQPWGCLRSNRGLAFSTKLGLSLSQRGKLRVLATGAARCPATVAAGAALVPPHWGGSSRGLAGDTRLGPSPQPWGRSRSSRGLAASAARLGPSLSQRGGSSRGLADTARLGPSPHPRERLRDPAAGAAGAALALPHRGGSSRGLAGDARLGPSPQPWGRSRSSRGLAFSTRLGPSLSQEGSLRVPAAVAAGVDLVLPHLVEVEGPGRWCSRGSPLPLPLGGLGAVLPLPPRE